MNHWPRNHWPLRDLVLRTPRLELRPDDDAGLDGLVEVAYEGVHPPDEMPFMVPWTDADPATSAHGMPGAPASPTHPVGRARR